MFFLINMYHARSAYLISEWVELQLKQVWCTLKLLLWNHWIN